MKEEKNFLFETFTVIDVENQDKILPLFCEWLLANNFNDNEQADNTSEEHSVHDDYDDLLGILKMLPLPYTIVVEDHYIDRDYRDTYYMYFSNQHFDTKRYSSRLSFFKGKHGFLDFFSKDIDNHNLLKESFMGICVINPLMTGAIGRTLIDPKYVLSKNNLDVYMRLSTFELSILGKKFEVQAFPFRKQDQETMRCAEITILNLLEYFSNTYNDYRIVFPNEIIEKEQQHSHERVLPSRGTSYPVLTKVLSEFGFSPRLYNIGAIESFCCSYLTRQDLFKRILYYYVESGIPVALNLASINKGETGHSIVCIGHGQKSEKLVRDAEKKKSIAWNRKEECHPLINSADFFEDFVVVDDNQPIYQVRKFSELSKYPELRVENIAVPLYKRMFLDAPNAYGIITSMLREKEFDIDNWAEGYLEKGEPIIIRMFMASSKNFKRFRTETLDSHFARECYAVTLMPRFVWVCELYRKENYDSGYAFGEIVIDATSAPNRKQKSLIMMHYPQTLILRYIDQNKTKFDEVLKILDDKEFKGYNHNLMHIGA